MYPIQYYCAITEDLDLIRNVLPVMKHYIQYFGEENGSTVWAIRKPGRTVGGIWIDENGVITDIKVGDDCVGGYPSRYTNYFKKYIGQKLEF